MVSHPTSHRAAFAEPPAGPDQATVVRTRFRTFCSVCEWQILQNVPSHEPGAAFAGFGRLTSEAFALQAFPMAMCAPPWYSTEHEWMFRGRRDKKMGAACLLPDCSAVVTQSFATAELPKFCSAAHRARFHRRRESLLSAAQGLQLELDRTLRMPQRRRLERELSFVVWLLDAQYGGRHRRA